MSDYLWASVAVMTAAMLSRFWYQAKLRVRFPEVWKSVAQLLDRPRSSRLMAACGLQMPGRVSRWSLWGADDRVPRVLAGIPTPAGADVQVHPAVGQSPGTVAAAADRIGAALGVPINSRLMDAGSVVWSLRVRDPLESEIRDVLRSNGNAPALVLGLTEDGYSIELPLVNTSGVVVAGIPGAGKSAALTRWMAELSASIMLALFVIDGKASADWLPFNDRATLMVQDGRFESALALLESVTEIMEHRLRNTSQMFDGVANFWDVAPAHRPSVVVVVIDECQVLFSGQGAKEEKTLSARCIQLTADLVRRGRSVGIVVICATQRPTVDAVPGAIRDNCSARISFRVMTSDSARAVLGSEFGSDGSVTPVGAPTGVGVVLADGLVPTRFRVPYATPSEVSHFVGTQGADRIPLDQLAPGLAYDVPLGASDGGADI